MNASRIAVVTTFSKAGWGGYARRMIETWLTHWPREVDLVVYPDEPVPLPDAPNLRVISEPNPAKQRFIDQWKDAPTYNGGAPYNYRFDAVKFCHKPFCLWHLMKTADAPGGYHRMIWLDADTLTHRKVTMDFVERAAPPAADIQFLGRSYKYTECGYLYFNLKRRGARAVLDRWVNYYVDGTFAQEKEWHDSWLFDRARQAENNLHAINLTGHLSRRAGAGHPFVNSFLGEYLDHLKGDSRKATGAPRKGDLCVDHEAPYWKAHPHAKAR